MHGGPLHARHPAVRARQQPRVRGPARGRGAQRVQHPGDRDLHAAARPGHRRQLRRGEDLRDAAGSLHPDRGARGLQSPWCRGPGNLLWGLLLHDVFMSR